MAKEREMCGVKVFVSGETYNKYKGTLEEQLEQKDKEIERLSKEVTKYDEILCERNNEVDRLNNIINKLEKELKECYEEYKDVEHIELRTSALEDLAILNRIRELKEGK